MRDSRLGRILVYLQFMFPPALMVPTGVATFLAAYWGLQALGGVEPLRVGWPAGLGAATVVLTMLLLRVFDELKDVEADLRLGAAGDPRYVDRPVVTGAVKVEDIVALRWTVTGGLFALNLPWALTGRWEPLVGFLVLYVLCWASFKWFFWPRIKDNLLLAFATHNPLTGVVTLFILALFVSEHGARGLGPLTAALLLGLWLPVSAWETSRKVRLPEQETSYQTYSMLLGWRVAALVPALFVAVSAVCLWFVAREAELSVVYQVALGLGAAVPIVQALLLEVAPRPALANLRPATEVYAVVVNVGLAIALGVRHGVAFG